MTTDSQPTPEQVVADHSFLDDQYACLCQVDSDVDTMDRQEHAAHVLAVHRDAGYAVVKLPEPDIAEDGVTDWECAPYRISTLDPFPGEVFPAYLGEPEEPLTPQGARELASALLAAADAADRAGDDGEGR